MQGLKPSQLNALERLYKRRFPKEMIYTPEQARELALLSRAMNRQLGLLVDRKGKVRMVIAGDYGSIYIPELPRLRDAAGRLRGWRLLHTHLGPEGLSQEDLMDLLFLRLDGAIALTVNEAGEPCQWQGAWLLPNAAEEKREKPFFVEAPKAWHDAKFDFTALAESLEDELDRLGAGNAGMDSGKRAVLVSVSTEPKAVRERNLDELEALAVTAGLEVGGRLAQRLSQPNPKLILGKGKLADLEVMALNARADILVFDGELSPAQLHNLADVTERKVLDRAQLILDIFAQHAVTRAGKLQVELAQLAYALPRLAGRSGAMDRLMGGIGGRGPGESKLETDRRKIRERMGRLSAELEKLKRQRAFMRGRRERNGVPVAALVGYTNAGKSTLLNRLTGSKVLAEDRLFATLDPATRRLRFPEEREITLSDTVGFIRNLPRELREAFQATLEELKSADLLIHVADASHPELARQTGSVEAVLEDLGLSETPLVLALNKCDRLKSGEMEDLKLAFPGAVFISAVEASGLDELLRKIEQSLFMERIKAAKRPRVEAEKLARDRRKSVEGEDLS